MSLAWWKINPLPQWTRQFVLSLPRFLIRFNAIWPRRSMAALVWGWTLAENYVTVMPSVTHVD